MILADNLEWVTCSESELHAFADNLVTIHKGSKKPLAKLSEKDITEIRKEYKQGKIQKELSCKYGVARQTISSIVNRRAWRHVE